MTSPVDTSVKFARSDMLGAPVLKPAAGSIISLLDAFLLNGWGLQMATSVVVSGGVATATFPTDHAAVVDSVVLVAGATPAGLNGEQKVTAIALNKVSWATGAPDGTATGSITVKMAAAGWAKPFTGTNLAVYRSAHPQSNGHYLRVNDANALYARGLAYETMSAVSTGTNPFPTNTQVSGGGYWGKSANTAHGRDIPWLAFSDGRILYLCILADQAELDQSSYSYSEIYTFGDPIPASAAGNPFGTVMCVSTTPSGRTETTGNGLGGAFVARSVSRVIGARNIAVEYIPQSPGRFPEPAFGGMWLAPVRVRELEPNGNAIGGVSVAPGVFRVETTGIQRVLGQWPVVPAAGRRYLLQNINGGYLTDSVSPSAAFDITGPWR